MTPTRRPSPGTTGSAVVVAVVAAALAGAAGVAVVGDPRLLLVPVVLAVLVGTVAVPEVGLVVLVALQVSRASLVLEELHDVPSFVVPYSALVLALALWRRAPGERFEPTALLGVALVAVYGLVLLSGYLYADEPELVWSAAQALVKETVAVLAVLALVRTGASLRVAVWAAVLAALAIALPNLYQHVTGTFERTWGGFARSKYGETFGIDTARIGGPVADPNYFAQTLVVGLALAVDRALHERTLRLQVVAAGSAGILAATILITRSRGGWLAMGLLAVIVAWRWRPQASTVVALGAVAVLALAVGPAGYRDGLRTLVDPLSGDDEIDGSLAARGHMVLIAGDMFLDHPIIGVGWDNYPVHFLEYAAERRLDLERRPRVPHTLYGEAAAEGGVLGLGALGALVGGALAVAARARRRVAGDDAHLVDGVLLATIGFLVTALFLSLSSPQVFFLVLALCFAAGSLPAVGDPVGSDVPAPAAAG